MTNETTASQPKSIGDDAQFIAMLRDQGIWCADDIAPFVAYIDSRAPAAQASASIQAAPERNLNRLLKNVGNAEYIESYFASLWGIIDDLNAHIDRSAATIQEPVMAAEPVGRIMSESNEAVAVFGIQVEKELCKLLGREWSVCGISIESLCADIAKRLAAPLVADPAGVATWQDRIQAVHPRSEAAHWPDDLKVKYMGDEIEAYRLAATVKAVPSEAHMEPVGHVKDYFPGTDKAYRQVVWADRTFAMDVPDGAPLFAAPLADKTGGGE